MIPSSIAFASLPQIESSKFICPDEYWGSEISAFAEIKSHDVLLSAFAENVLPFSIKQRESAQIRAEKAAEDAICIDIWLFFKVFTPGCLNLSVTVNICAAEMKVEQNYICF